MGPTVTSFFGRGARSDYPFVSGSVGLTRFTRGDRDGGQTQARYRGAGGVLVMLSSSVGVTGALFYQHTDAEQLQTSTFGLAFGVSAFLFCAQSRCAQGVLATAHSRPVVAIDAPPRPEEAME